jgi:hypothetical protein
MDRRPGGPQSRSGHGGEEKNSQPLPGLKLTYVQIRSTVKQVWSALSRFCYRIRRCEMVKTGSVNRTREWRCNWSKCSMWNEHFTKIREVVTDHQPAQTVEPTVIIFRDWRGGAFEESRSIISLMMSTKLLPETLFSFDRSDCLMTREDFIKQSPWKLVTLHFTKMQLFSALLLLSCSCTTVIAVSHNALPRPTTRAHQAGVTISEAGNVNV